MYTRLSERILIRNEEITTKIRKRDSGFIISIFNSILFILCSNKAHTVVMTGTGFIIAKFRQQNTFTDEILITFAP